MKQKFQLLTYSLLLLSGALFFLGFINKPGGDYFSVSLNGKLITEQYLTQNRSAMASLSLSGANASDQLFVQYKHCGTAGKERVITLKDEKGNGLKQWKFANVSSTVMQIPVKEIWQATGKVQTALLYYSSKELTNTCLLTSVKLNRTVAAKL